MFAPGLNFKCHGHCDAPYFHCYIPPLINFPECRSNTESDLQKAGDKDRDRDIERVRKWSIQYTPSVPPLFCRHSGALPSFTFSSAAFNSQSKQHFPNHPALQERYFNFLLGDKYFQGYNLRQPTFQVLLVCIRAKLHM